MTRADIITLARDILGEDPDTAAGRRSVAWDRWVTEAANEVAREVDSLYVSFAADVSAGQSQVCLPPLKRIKAVYTTDASGSKTLLRVTTPNRLDASYYGWRNDNAGTPAYFVTEGLNTALLYPTPDTTQAGGLTVEGWGLPAPWPNPSDPCPLAPRAHSAVAYKAALLRIMQRPTAENLARRPMLEAQYQRHMGELEAECRLLTSATRAGTFEDAGVLSPTPYLGSMY